MERKIIVGNTYKHFKGHIYKVIAIANDSENYDEENPELSKMVVYQNVNDENQCWVRPYQMFNSLVDKEKYPSIKQKYRFEEVPKKDNKIELDGKHETFSTYSGLPNQMSENIETFADDLEIINQEWYKLPDAGLCNPTLDSECNSNNSFELKKSRKN